MTDAAMIARMEALATSWGKHLPHDPLAEHAADLDALLAERERLVVLLGEAEGALEPFANHPVLATFPNAKDDAQAPVSQWQNPLTIRDFRHAATILQRIKETTR